MYQVDKLLEEFRVLMSGWVEPLPCVLIVIVERIQAAECLMFVLVSHVDVFILIPMKHRKLR